MPRLVKLQEEHKEKLVVIGPHCQNVDKAQVLERCRELKINYTITNNGSVKGKNFSGIPKCFVFDHTGALIFDGRPDSEMDKIVEKAIKASPDWLVGDHAYAKLKAQAANVAARKSLGKVLAECRELAKGEDETSKTEAGWLLERLKPWAEGMLDSAKKAESDDPTKSLDLYTKASALFPGDEIGTAAADAVKRLKADPQFKKELESAQALKQVKEVSEKLKPCKSTQPLDIVNCEDCRHKNAAAINSLIGQLRGIAKRYEGTKAAKEADALLKLWGG